MTSLAQMRAKIRKQLETQEDIPAGAPAEFANVSTSKLKYMVQEAYVSDLALHKRGAAEIERREKARRATRAK